MKTTKILSLIAFLFCFTLNLRAQSGTCGTNLTWELVNDTLIITGSGAMDNSRPWNSYSSQIVHISISEGVTNICNDAFRSFSKLQSVVISNTVTSIGDNAFSYSSLSQIEMGRSVEVIGDYAFRQSKLTAINLPTTLVSIGDDAFYDCTQLQAITIPGSLTSIPYQAFYNCSSLKTLIIEDGVLSIGESAFQKCSRLTNVSIPEGVITIASRAFEACTKMTEILLPSSLTSIGVCAFQDCSALASIVIPEKITSIESDAFDGCSALRNVTLPANLQTIKPNAFRTAAFTHIDIPNSVTDIQEHAFASCKNLVSVTLPPNLTVLKSSIFYDCPTLSSVTIPEGVTIIHGGAFYGCNLTEIKLPNSLEAIGNNDKVTASNTSTGAFGHNTNLTSIVIPKSVQRIGSYAFEGCTSLSQITLQEGLKEIGASAFQGCSALRSIVIPEGVTAIEEHTFDGCTYLSQVTLFEGITTIGSYAFKNCVSLHSITLPEGLTTIEGAAFYNCDLIDLSLPQSLQIIGDGIHMGYSDYAGAFYNNKNLTTIVFPDNVTKIGTFAFHGCNRLQNIVLDANLLTLGEYVFRGCSDLLSITIPNKITSIPANAFYGCSALSEVNLPEGLISIGEMAFAYCSSLKTVQLPKTVTSLYRSFATSGVVEMDIPEGIAVLELTFDGCSKLKKVTLPSTLTTLGNHTFKNCTSLPTITLPQGLLTIGSYVFSGCTALDSITLPSQLTSIGTEAFMSCAALRKITIPNSVKSISSYAFKDCKALREITIPNQVKTISSYLFEGCTALTSVTLPYSIAKIDNYAFHDCTALQELTLPEGLTTIGSCAFYNCSALRSLTIPSTVVDLKGSYMFQSCSSLVNLNLLPPNPPALNSTFEKAPSNLKINLLCGSKEAYMADANWAKLTYPINEIFSNILTIKSNDNRMGEAYIPTPNTCDNDTAIIEALPREGYQFAAWHDGNTDNPRTILVTQDTTFTANFEPLTTYQLTVNYDPKQGHISGIGEYYPNEEATLTVTPLGGYRFKQWGDGNTDNPRTIIMTQDTTLEALFIMGDYCGDDILYTFLNDTLALNGTGDMWNLSQYGWNMYADEVLALTLSNGITSIGTNAFMNLMFLPEVTIPASVKTIHKRAFENCRSLSSVTFAPNSQLQTIDHWAFYECINLKALEIPEGVTTIGNGAFYGCAYLDSIVLPASMMSIADNGFAQCTKLSAMTVHAITPPAVDSKTFESVNRAIPVYVPFGTGATYRATPIWQEFNIQEMEAIDDPCANAIEVNWDMGLKLSQLSAGWYKLYVGDIHANQADFTSTIINDLACDVILSSSIHIDCADEESLVEGSKRVTMGIHTKTITYAEFAGMIPAYVDYLYLNIESIVEDCEPTPSSCEDAIEVELDYTSRIESPCEVWYRLGVHDLPMEVDFTPDADDSVWGPEFYIDFTCTPGVYDDPKVDSMMIELGKSEPGITMPIGLVMDRVNRQGKMCYNLYITQNYRNLFVQYGGITYNVPMYIKVMYFEPGEISFKRRDAKETIEETVTICDGESYTWDKDGWRYTESGNYITLSSDGETYYVLHLTVIEPQSYPVERITICEGETYIWRGMELSQGGSYTDVEQDPTTGCDIAIYTLQLTVEDCAPPCEDITTEEYATVCYGETYTWNGQDYATEGAYTMTFSTSNGCDSTVTLHLTILPEAVTIEESVTLNEEQLPYIWRGQSCDHAGVYTISEPFANYPYCDSLIYVLNLIVDAPNKCGDHLYWHYSNNTMTITGYGAMYDDPDLLSYRTQDWYPARVNNIVLPDAIIHIGNVAFADCANLTSIVIPSSVNSIGDGAFSWTGLQSVTIPASVTELGEQVFETCNDLRTILYEGNPIAINNQTVHPLIGCVHLDTIIAPAALWHCTTADPALEARYGVPHKARYIEVTDGELTNQAIRYIANNSGAMEILDLTNATNTTLPYGAWSNNYQLSTLYLPQQIEVIPESMVEGARNLSEIAIPATVMEIGNYAFSGCVNVWRMTVDAVIPPKVYENTFDGISRSISVQVPAGSEELYREAAYWREFFIEHTSNPSPISNCQKLLRKDQILILRNGKVYTTMGQLINTEE